MDMLQRIRRSATIALILSPAGLLTIAATRLLIVSNYNPDTASAIIASGGYVDTLLGTILPAIPFLLPYLGLVLLFFRRVIPGMLVLVAAAMTSPSEVTGSSALNLARSSWNDTLGYGLWLLVVVLLVLVLPFGFTQVAKTAGIFFALALIPYVVQAYPLSYENDYAAQLRRPWLPADSVTLKSRERIVGYTLPSNGGWLVFLRDDTRRVVYYPPDAVVGRQACQTSEASSTKPLITLTPAPTLLPPCVQWRPALPGAVETSAKRECQVPGVGDGDAPRNGPIRAPADRRTKCTVVR